MSAGKKMDNSYSNTHLGPFSSRRFFTSQQQHPPQAQDCLNRPRLQHRPTADQYHPISLSPIPAMALFNPHVKTSVHAVYILLVVAAMGLSVPRLFMKNQPRTRANTIALGMVRSSPSSLPNADFRTHTNRRAPNPSSSSPTKSPPSTSDPSTAGRATRPIGS
jgi:hypothetical protein